MKLWELYIKEREGAEVLYDDHSFMTYRVMEDQEVLILDVFAEREYRKKGLIAKLWKELLEKTKPKIIYTMSDVTAFNWESSHEFIMSFGFTPCTQEGSMVYYYQEIR